MKILVTGATGFVGRALCVALIRQGFNVLAAVREAASIEGCLAVVVGDINSTTNWATALPSVDVVVHLAARAHIMNDLARDPLAEFRKVNVDGTLNLAHQAAQEGIRRFVFISSIGVNGLFTFNGDSFNERDLPNPHNAYAISKWEAEQGLHQIAQKTGLEVVIVRPPLIYGAGAKGNLAQMVSIVTRGVPLPFSSVNNKRSLIYVGNLVDALLLCATHPAAAGQTYLVSDDEEVSTPDLLRKLALAIGKKPRLFSFPADLLRLAGLLTGKSEQVSRLLGSLRIDSGKIRSELGWEPPFSLEDGIKATVQDKCQP